jgi:biotin transport system substrate-specific component
MIIYFAVYVLGLGLGTCSVTIYLLLGLTGLPVFSSFTGGAGKLIGPTGGYLIGYLFIACISGLFFKKCGSSYTFRKLIICFFGMTLGTIVCYLLGTLWLSYQLSLSFTTALSVGVLPYIPLDILKMILALILGRSTKKRLTAAGLF